MAAVNELARVAYDTFTFRQSAFHDLTHMDAGRLHACLSLMMVLVSCCFEAAAAGPDRQIIKVQL